MDRYEASATSTGGFGSRHEHLSGPANPNTGYGSDRIARRSWPIGRTAIHLGDEPSASPLGAASLPQARGLGEPLGHGRAETWRRPLVLIVDDNLEILELNCLALGRYFEVVAAEDGEQAWEMLQQRLPDLILSDVAMPRLDGIGLLALVRQDPATCKVPVVFLTSLDWEELPRPVAKSDVQGYIRKPYGLMELVQRVQHVLAMARALPGGMRS